MRLSLRRRPAHVPCIEFVELVTEYLEGTLPARQVRAIDHHLELCDPCVIYLDQMRETVRLGGRVQIDHVSDEVLDDLMEMYRSTQKG